MLILLLYFVDMSLLFGQPDLVQLEQRFLDAIFAHFLIFEFHLQQDFVACCGRPNQTFVDFDITAAASSLPFWITLRAVFGPFGNVLQVMNLLEVISKVPKLPILFSILEK